MSTMTETCACGASLAITSSWSTDLAARHHSGARYSGAKRVAK